MENRCVGETAEEMFIGTVESEGSKQQNDSFNRKETGGKKSYYVKKHRPSSLEEFGVATQKPPHKPGVCRAIFDTLRKATEKKPMTVKDVVKALERKFKGREPAKMEATVLVARRFIPVHYPFKVMRKGDGYWLEPLPGVK